MFNLKSEAGDNAGYELRIGYDTKRDKFYVRGYAVFVEPRYEMKEYERDGATLWFDTQEAAFQHIADYQYHIDQQSLDYEAEEQ